VDTAATETAPNFSIFYPDEQQVTVADPTTEDDGDLVDQFEPASPVHSIPSHGGNGDDHTPRYHLSGDLMKEIWFSGQRHELIVLLTLMEHHCGFNHTERA